MTHSLLRTAAAAALLAAPATAQEVALGIGWNALDGVGGAPAGFVEGRFGTFRLFDGVSLRIGGVLEADTDGDLFGGLGPVLGWAFLPGWKLEGSFMPGVYIEGAGADLGSTCEFRSFVGISYAIDDSYRLGVAWSHKSNAGLDEYNPGEDSAWLYVARQF